MNKISSYPEILQIGNRHILDIFDSDVEISEKIDGSFLGAKKIEDGLLFRSKNAQIFPEAVPKMFQTGVEYLSGIPDRLEPDITYYVEYLSKPKHNVLVYDRVPKNNLILFGVQFSTGEFVNSHSNLKRIADILDIEVVPLIFQGKITNPEVLLEMLERDSILGGTKIEGVVVKNYTKPYLIGSKVIEVMAGKYVSEKFKEKHEKDWKKDKTSKGRLILYKENFRTEARWLKAVQHLKETDELEGEPRDIGKLVKEIQLDIEKEEKENIKEMLWKEFGGQILRHSVKGFPEFYKEYLLKQVFEIGKEVYRKNVKN